MDYKSAEGPGWHVSTANQSYKFRFAHSYLNEHFVGLATRVVGPLSLVLYIKYGQHKFGQPKLKEKL